MSNKNWQMYLTTEPPAGRGCGKKRDEGGLYASCGVGEEGMPIEHFLFDPVRPRSWQRGYEILADSYGTHHLIIYIGQSGKEADDSGYPSAWDYIEETRLYGASRKLPRTILNNPDFVKLENGKSQMILVHAKAIPLFDYELNREERPLYGCKLFQDFVDNPERWQSLKNIAGYHPVKCKFWQAVEYHELQERCTLALRDLAYFSRDWTNTDDIIEPVERDWQRFTAKGPSYEFTGNVPKLPEYTGEKLSWASGAFMSLPFHFEIPHSDKNNIASKVAQTGIAVEVVDW